MSATKLSRRTFLQTSSLTLSCLSAVPISFQSDFDVVILDGRVIDPETALDSVRNVGIKDGKIAAITKKAIRGKKTIVAKGLVVCPGFIDPISHGQNIANDRVQAYDGVTTKLQMESGVEDQTQWHKEQKGNRILNYGAGCGHSHAREKYITNVPDYNVAVATDSQIAGMANYLDRELLKGALGVGFGLEYNPTSTRWEVLQMFKVAGKHRAPCHLHTRYGTLLEEQSNITAIQEAIAASVLYGAPAHIVHVPSMALGNTSRALEIIAQAQRRKLDVSCDFYPYTAFGTGIASEVFAPGWEEKFGMSYGDLEWAKTHERLTKQTFEKYREEGGFVIAHCIPEKAVQAAVKAPFCMVGSDGSLRDGVGHPRSSGTFSRVLGRYVRDLKIISLPEAIAKMTLLTAKRFEPRCPAFRRKGRLQVGCDADVVVFDARTVADRSTYSEPALTSRGFQEVIVGGVSVISEGKLIEDVRPGRPLRAGDK